MAPSILGAQGTAPRPRAVAVGTSRLGIAEPLIRIELSLGQEVFGSTDPYGAGRLERLAVVAVRIRDAGEPGYRLWVLHARRGASDYNPAATFLTTGVSFDLPLQLDRRISVAPSYGVGYAIAVNPSEYNGSGEERMVASLGLALRYRRVVAEAQLLVLGGDLFRTLTLGFRI